MDELRTHVEELRSEILELSEIAELSADQEARWAAANEEFDAARAELDAAEARAARIDEVRSVAVAHPAAVVAGSIRDNAPNVNRGIDPFAGDFRHDSDQEVIDRARTAAEKFSSYRGVSSDDRDAVLETLERYQGETARDIAEIVLVTGSPEYVRGFEAYTSNPGQGAPAVLSDLTQSRTAMAVAAANGGYLIPHFLDPTIRLTNSGTNNVIRQVASTTQITTNKWEGVTSAGVTAQWLAEATEAADASPTFQGPNITPQKAAAWLYGSYEMLADTGFGPVGELIADAFDRLEETAFTTGTGSGQPYGLITQLSGTGPSVAGSSGAAGAADFVIADVYAVKNALTPRYRKAANWMANPAVADKIRQFGNSASGNNQANFWVDLGAGTPASLLGRPFHEDEAMDGTIVSGSNDDILLFGDFSQYLIVDRVGTTVMYNPLVLGSNRIPNGQAGWFAYKRVGADVITSNGFKLLRV